MRTVNQWLDEYGESHRNETNKLIHWFCVPSIFFSITGLLYSIKFPFQLTENLRLNVAMIVLLLAVIYYFTLSVSLGFGMLLFGVFCLAICYLIETYLPLSLWLFCLIVFIAAWIGQFYGHKVEGKKPSFFKDLQFLLIGPMWLMSFIYKKVGVKY
ncbi:MAG: Mpo1-like protein [Ginsengibacter sp.]